MNVFTVLRTICFVKSLRYSVIRQAFRWPSIDRKQTRSSMNWYKANEKILC